MLEKVKEQSGVIHGIRAPPKWWKEWGDVHVGGDGTGGEV